MSQFSLPNFVWIKVLVADKKAQTRETISVSLQLDCNETEVILSPENGLEADQNI